MNKELVDTHCHLYLEDFEADLADVLSRAAAEGVRRIYMPSIDSNHLNRMLELQKTYNGTCYSMLGLHPCSVREDYRDELQKMKDAVEKDQFYAIGEIGLDYYWDRSFDEQQMICFRRTRSARPRSQISQCHRCQELHSLPHRPGTPLRSN